jgi:hypothetical protein
LVRLVGKLGPEGLDKHFYRFFMAAGGKKIYAPAAYNFSFFSVNGNLNPPLWD